MKQSRLLKQGLPRLRQRPLADPRNDVLSEYLPYGYISKCIQGHYSSISSPYCNMAEHSRIFIWFCLWCLAVNIGLSEISFGARGIPEYLCRMVNEEIVINGMLNEKI